jgi:hypothetical protein
MRNIASLWLCTFFLVAIIPSRSSVAFASNGGGYNRNRNGLRSILAPTSDGLISNALLRATLQIPSGGAASAASASASAGSRNNNNNHNGVATSSRSSSTETYATTVGLEATTTTSSVVEEGVISVRTSSCVSRFVCVCLGEKPLYFRICVRNYHSACVTAEHIVEI